MPKSSSQKLKILYVYKILFEMSDESHPLTMRRIIAELGRYGIKAERKSVYDDIELLKTAGADIIMEKRETYAYYIGERAFQLAELKLLVDSVQASKFITAKKSAELIAKLGGLTDKYSARDLQRQVYITDRVKAFNERIYYNTDLLHSAIGNGKKVRFKYYRYNTKSAKEFRNDGKFYVVSPYGLVYSDENYYLLAHYPKYDGITNFRVDKMTDISVLDENIESAEEITGGKFNPADYTKKMFNMYGGKTETVGLTCSESVLGVVTDKFGEDIFLRKTGENKYAVTIKADISPTFFAWVFMLGENAEIVSPANVVSEYKKMLKGILKKY